MFACFNFFQSHILVQVEMHLGPVLIDFFVLIYDLNTCETVCEMHLRPVLIDLFELI